MTSTKVPRVALSSRSRVQVLLYCGARSPLPRLLTPLAEVWAVNDLRDVPRWLGRCPFGLVVCELWTREEEREFLSLLPTEVPAVCLWFGSGEASPEIDESVRVYTGHAGFSALLQLVSEHQRALIPTI